MNETRDRLSRRSSLVQRAVVGGGVFGALGAAFGVGTQIHPHTSDTSTTQQQPSQDDQPTRTARTSRDRPVRHHHRTRRTTSPSPQPQPGSTTSTHGTSSGS